MFQLIWMGIWPGMKTWTLGDASCVKENFRINTMAPGISSLFIVPMKSNNVHFVIFGVRIKSVWINILEIFIRKDWPNKSHTHSDDVNFIFLYILHNILGKIYLHNIIQLICLKKTYTYIKPWIVIGIFYF